MIVPKTYVGETRYGKGLFAGESIPEGGLVVHLLGPRIQGPEPDCGRLCDVTQIGSKLFLGSSFRRDDYINHSCDPNCFQRVCGHEVGLYALRSITEGEEVTFDYALTTTPDALALFPNLRFLCACGSVQCRGSVGSVVDIPEEQLRLYARRGILPPYVRPYLDAFAPRVALPAQRP